MRNLLNIRKLKTMRTQAEKYTSGGFMKTYYITNANNRGHYLSILNESEAGFMTRIYREEDGYEETIENFMSRELFDICLRTGYIVETEEKKAEATA